MYRSKTVKLLLFFCAFIAGPAVAGLPEPSGALLVIERLEGAWADGNVVIEVAVDARSWSWAVDNMVEPVLVAELEFGDRQEMVRTPLTQRVSRIELPGHPERVDVSLSNTGAGWQLNWFKLGGARVQRVELALGMVEKPSKGSKIVRVERLAPGETGDDLAVLFIVNGRAGDDVPDWRADKPTIRACARAFKTDSYRAACVDAVAHAPESPVAHIKSCAKLGYSQRAFDCIEHVGWR